ncbi:MAG: hypothetical protein VXZ72_01460 [Chlamydiota bacterium]|nr:hypothetical protein [Chlamydiota bacterium]
MMVPEYLMTAYRQLSSQIMRHLPDGVFTLHPQTINKEMKRIPHLQSIQQGHLMTLFNHKVVVWIAQKFHHHQTIMVVMIGTIYRESVSLEQAFLTEEDPEKMLAVVEEELNLIESNRHALSIYVDPISSSV